MFDILSPVAVCVYACVYMCVRVYTCVRVEWIKKGRCVKVEVEREAERGGELVPASAKSAYLNALWDA